MPPADNAEVGSQSVEFSRPRLPIVAINGNRNSSLADQPGRDPRRFEDHRQPAAGVRPAADQVNRFEVFESILRPQMQHLREGMGQIEGRAQMDLVIQVPVRRASPFARIGSATRRRRRPIFAS